MSTLISKTCSSLHGTAKVPGDKSISHRALMLGGLCMGQTQITGLLESEDVLRTAEAMRQLGAEVKRQKSGPWHVYGTGIGGLHEPEKALKMGNSGTSARLLMGLVAGHNISARFTGDASLSKRPMNRIIKPLEMMCASFEASEGGRLPLRVTGAEDTLCIEYRLPVASAQVKSAILLAGLNARGRTCVIEDKPTRDHTENMLACFGVEVKTEELEGGALAVSVTGQQKMRPCSIEVPGDPSSAAFPAVAALINEGSEIHLPGICMNPRRAGLYATLREMGADIAFENERQSGGELISDLTVKASGPLRGIDVPPERVPTMIDEFPVLAMAAACAKGTTRMSGLAELRVKESDRLLLVAEGLKACGVDVEMGEDSLSVHGIGKPPKGGAKIKTALDHRIAMSFLVLGAATAEPVTIDDARPIATSFPGFADLMNDLGCRIEET